MYFLLPMVEYTEICAEDLKDSVANNRVVTSLFLSRALAIEYYVLLWSACEISSAKKKRTKDSLSSTDYNILSATRHR
jgi:hypothetical protein